MRDGLVQAVLRKTLDPLLLTSGLHARSTKEACGFRAPFSLLREWDVEIVSISSDSEETHLRFKSIHHLS